MKVVVLVSVALIVIEEASVRVTVTLVPPIMLTESSSPTDASNLMAGLSLFPSVCSTDKS